MTVLFILFLGTATLLWLCLFGYALVLILLFALRRHEPERSLSTWPEIAIVIPTLNEEDLIVSKLSDLRQGDYPRDRITVVVVDEGSTNETTALVRQEITRGEPIQLICIYTSQFLIDRVVLTSV